MFLSKLSFLYNLFFESKIPIYDNRIVYLKIKYSNNNILYEKLFDPNNGIHLNSKRKNYETQILNDFCHDVSSSSGLAQMGSYFMTFFSDATKKPLEIQFILDYIRIPAIGHQCLFDPDKYTKTIFTYKP
jgi:hypothetical protein